MGDAGLRLGSTLHAEGLLELVEQKMGCSCTVEAEKFLLVGAEGLEHEEEIFVHIARAALPEAFDYVFVSHMETDEAGGVFALHEAFLDMKVICGHLAARELPGWTMQAGSFLRYGNGVGQTMKASWADEVSAIDAERVPHAEKRGRLQQTLSALSPRFVAVGHGFCLECA